MRAPMSEISKMKSFVVLFIVLFYGSCQSQGDSLGSIIEIVDNESILDNNKILELCKLNDIDPKSVYNWENHWLLYTEHDKASLITEKIRENLTKVVVKFYKAPFYKFDRQEHCGKQKATKWSNIIMTASLVDDKNMQDEYMEYHRTQFENWIEVSTGFCNANFQQVLLYREESQLMLVISIPEGEDFNELNPKTVENNPRVDEWNQIMSKYQKGIDDVPEDIVWVEFKSVY